MIGVVCEMFEIHPQTLRMYEKEGLLNPQRVSGARLYSQEDLERIRVILNLTKELGVNRAGVDIILRMRRRVETLQRELDNMLDYLELDMQKRFRKRLKDVFQEDDE